MTADIVHFISHPEVRVDATVPVPDWSLSDAGAARMRIFAGSGAMQAVTSIWSSGERKAIEAAAILSEALGLAAHVDEALHENDRSATGFVPPAEFEALADQFFSRPDDSVRGWERARDAQARVLAAVERVIAGAVPGDIAVVAHGGVGTLLQCHCRGVPISRAYDQPWQGHVWRMRRADMAFVSGWESIAPRS